jgi:hypothetical protein
MRSKLPRASAQARRTAGPAERLRLAPVRGAVLALLASVTVLGMSGCGGGAKTNPVVERDLGRVSRAFSGWATVPSLTTTCPDVAGGSPSAIATKALVYPPQAEDPWDTIYIGVEYRSPQNVRRDIAGFATTAELDCRAAAHWPRRASSLRDGRFGSGLDTLGILGARNWVLPACLGAVACAVERV